VGHHWNGHGILGDADGSGGGKFGGAPHFDMLPSAVISVTNPTTLHALDLFLHAARGLGAQPSRCVVIEDSVNGVLAGRTAGMIVWGFVGGRHCSEASGAELSEAGAERIVRDWPDFSAVLA